MWLTRKRPHRWDQRTLPFCRRGALGAQWELSGQIACVLPTTEPAGDGVWVASTPDINPPADETRTLWFEVTKPLMSTEPNRGMAHLEAFINYANHAQKLALYRAHRHRRRRATRRNRRLDPLATPERLDVRRDQRRSVSLIPRLRLGGYSGISTFLIAPAAAWSRV